MAAKQMSRLLAGHDDAHDDRGGTSLGQACWLALVL